MKFDMYIMKFHAGLFWIIFVHLSGNDHAKVELNVNLTGKK